MFAKFDAPVIYANNTNLIEDANANFNTLVNTIIANNSSQILNTPGAAAAAANAGFCANAGSLHTKKYASNGEHNMVESSSHEQQMSDENGASGEHNEVNSLNLDFDDVNSKSDMEDYYTSNCASQANDSSTTSSKNVVNTTNSSSNNNNNASGGGGGAKNELVMNANQNANDASHVGSCINSGADLLSSTNTSSSSNILFHANEQNENNYYTHIRSTLGPSTTNMLLNVGNRLMMGNANAAMNLLDTVAASSSSSSPSSSLSSPSSSTSNTTISKESCAILKSIANSANMNNGNISTKHDHQANAIFSNQTNDLALYIRNTHCVKEKIRRDRIKASCIHLRRLLPNVNGIKTDMATLLETTVVWAQLINACVPEEYVKNIKSKLSEYASLKNSACGGGPDAGLAKAALNNLRTDKIGIPRLKSKMSSKSGSLSKQQSSKSSQMASIPSQAGSCHQNNLNASISSISSSSFDSASPNASISPISLPSISSSFQATHHHAHPTSSSTPNLIMPSQAQGLGHPGAHGTGLNNIAMPINAAAAAAAAACMNMNMKPACQGWLSLSQQSKLAPSFHAMPLHLAAPHGAADKSISLNEAFLLNHHQQQQQQQQQHQHNMQLYNSMQMAESASGIVGDCGNTNFNQILNNHHQNMTNAKRIMSYLNNQSNQSHNFGK